MVVFAAKLFRKFAIRYVRLHPFAERLREHAVRISSLPDWREFFQTWYSPDREWPQPTQSSSQPDLIAAGAEP